MASLEEAARVVKSSFGTKQNKIEWQIATLGNGKGLVDAGNGYVYVRLKENSSVVEVLNDGVSLTDGMLVRIEKPAHDPIHWHVVSKNDQRIDESSNDPSGYNVGPHHRTHEYLGVDQVNSDFRQITNLRVYAVSGTFTVGILLGLIPRSGANKKVPSQTLDLTAHVPTSGARFCLISVDSSGTLIVSDGTVMDGILSLSAETDIPATPSGNWRLAAVRLYAGQTAISESTTSNDMIDLRFPEERIAGDPSTVFGTQAAYSLFGVGSSPALPSFIAATTSHIQSGVFPISRGGTNAATANTALNNLLPTQAGQSGNVLGTDGANASWVPPGGGGGGGTIVITSLPIGTITPFGGSSIPSGWLECNGAAVSRATYADLFTAIGVTYGSGDGSTTFNLPDLRGRTSIGQGTGSGLTPRTIGATGGEETHVLITAEMPAHTHGIDLYDASSGSPVVTKTGDNAGNIATIQSGSAGSGGAHNTMPPFLVTAFIIKYTDTATSALIYDDAGATISQVTLTTSGTGVRIYAARDDHHHQLDQSISPTMTGAWTFKNNDINSIGDDTSAAFIHTQYSATKTASFIGQRARGSLASPTALQADDVITRYVARGYGATGFGANQVVGVRLIANETFTDSAQGTRIEFWTTPNGSITQALASTISNAGHTDLNNHALVNVSNIAVGSSSVPDILARFFGDNGSFSRVAMRGYSNNAAASSIRVTKFRGTPGVPAVPQSGDSLGMFTWAGYSGLTADGIAGAYIEAKTTELWSTTANGTSLYFNVTANTTAGPALALTLNQDKTASFASSITSTTLNLSATSNQVVMQSAGVTGTLTWTPTSTNKTITFPDATGTVALINYANAGNIQSQGSLISGQPSSANYKPIYIDPNDADSRLWNWNIGTFSNAPTDARNNVIINWGYNQLSGGGPEDATEASFFTQLESFYHPAGGNPLFEYHLNYYNGATNYRPYFLTVDRTLHTATHTYLYDVINFSDRATAAVQWQLSGANFTSNQAAATLVKTVNNTVFLQQRNAAGTLNLNLLYLNSSDQAVCEPALRVANNITLDKSGASPAAAATLEIDVVGHLWQHVVETGGNFNLRGDSASRKIVVTQTGQTLISNGLNTPATQLHVIAQTTTANAALEVARIEARVSTASTGGDAGFGPSLNLYGESATDTDYRPMGRVSSLWQTATDASAVADMVLESYYNNGGTFTASEFIRGRAGSISLIGIGGVTTPTARLHLPAGGTEANSAPLKLTTQANPLTVVEQGTFELVGNSLQFSQLARRRGVVMSQNTRTSDFTLAASSGTSESAAVVTSTHGAGYLEVGKSEEIVLVGTMSQRSNPNANLTIRVKYAGSTALTFATAINNAIAANSAILIRIYCTCRTTGATGTLQINAVVEINGTATDPQAATLVTIDTTTAQDTTATFQWGSDTDAANTITIHQARVLCVEPSK